MSSSPTAPPGKRVSWVELYLDLIFALAVGQLAHVIVADPEMGSVWIALGLFVTMWWTWIGFAVLYNRDGDDASAGRLLFLVASVPTGVAAVAIEPASLGHVAAFAVAMAVTRAVLASARVLHGGWRAAARMAIVRAYVLSATLFTVSIALSGPARFVLWGIATSMPRSRSTSACWRRRADRRRSRGRCSRPATWRRRSRCC